MIIHKPVLLKEVLKNLDPKPNENFIDCTIGEGGHTTAILKKNKPKGRVLGIEVDPEIYQGLKKRILEFQDRLILVNDSYLNLKEIVEKSKFEPAQGILFDLGMSSWQLEKSGRGFTFLRDEPLDMRFNPKTNSLTAQDILNNWSEEKIEKILRDYGEERFAKKIASEIIKERKIKPIKTTFHLVELIRTSLSARTLIPRYRSELRKAIPKRYQHQRIHFATRTFQALRIAVNDELNNLKKVLPQTIEVLKPGGRLVIISFHSLEDRIVKNFFKNSSELKILTKKPTRPNQEEIKNNPRSRSAKLRAAIKI